ncbi:hypothetical protein [Nonomuraea glycinis]|uniref:hypothetical protein n=1 Tax=Nonomuraea glycinis TaxID=2047744 RepID=UPI00339DE75B
MKHYFKLDEDGDVDEFALEGGIHNGPECLRCKAMWCMWCARGRMDEECPGWKPGYVTRRVRRARSGYHVRLIRRRRRRGGGR